MTSDAPGDATAGTPYIHEVVASGTPTPTITVTEGELPPGLTITDGVISGTPTTPGTSTFTVTASNGDEGDVTATYTIVTEEAPAVPIPPTTETPVTPVTPGDNVGSGTGGSLAATGFGVGGLIAGAMALLAAGLVFTLRTIRRRS
ncbi:putative Ig domain-containing protein [Agreia sp. Leaf210]|uniref:putative Ig domain-containing protein n=1 Tax=Agreia sp. Leaf210 TaxID=1735682 RepID=UPI001F306060|nr:putative Ig domain-containing protein [Agreia sp. Leaf210]